MTGIIVSFLFLPEPEFRGNSRKEECVSISVEDK